MEISDALCQIGKLSMSPLIPVVIVHAKIKELKSSLSSFLVQVMERNILLFVVIISQEEFQRKPVLPVERSR